MQIDGMLRVAGMIAPIFVLLIVTHTSARPLQYLQPIEGYIPVYIRYGDQPLEEINPELAEAFHEPSFVSKRAQSDLSESEKINKELIASNDMPSESKEENADRKVIQESRQGRNYSLQESKPIENVSGVNKQHQSSQEDKMMAKNKIKISKTRIPCASCKVPGINA